MASIPNRLVIYTKDVMNITGRKQRTAQKLLWKIRKVYGKDETDFVTIQEFCDYTGLSKEEVLQFLK